VKTTVLREQLQQDGVQSLSNEELLTLIVCAESSTGRKAILKQIQQLFAACGDLRGVMCAEFGEICLHHGFDERRTAQLQAVLELSRRLATQSPTKKYQIRSADDAASLLRLEMMYLDYEQMRVLVLDTKNQVLVNTCLYQGTVNSAVLRVAEVLRPAVVRKAPNIIVCHNHPSGDPTPSPEDIEVTKQLAQAAQVLDIELLDHIIIGNPRYVSLKERLHW
jgi:DNA repair protein RadC